MIDIPIEEIIELSNSGMSDRQIARYFTERGRTISVSTVGRKIKQYYKDVKRKERIPVKGGRPKANIDIEKLIKLKEQGMTYVEIVDWLSKQQIKVDLETVRRRIKKYYRNIQGDKSTENVKRMMSITDQELEKLNKKGMSDREISEYFKDRKKSISPEMVGKRLKAYYQTKGKEKLKNKGGRPKKDMNEIEIFELKELGLTDKQITEYLKEEGIDVNVVTVTRRLNSYYKSEGQIKPIIEMSNKVGREECDSAIAYVKKVLEKAKEKETNLSNSGEER